MRQLLPVAIALAVAVPLLEKPVAIAAPAQAAPATPKVPFETRTLPGSNAVLYAMQDNRLPRVWYDLYLEAGERYVPGRLAGLTSLAAEVLDRGPSTTPYETYRRDLFRQGVEISWEPTNHFMIAHVKCRPDQLAATTRLVRQTAAHPRLDSATFNQLKGRVITQRQSMDDDMRTLTFHYANQKLWDFHPNARRPEGWAETMGAITPKDLAQYFTERLKQPGAYMSAAGPLPPAKLAAGVGPAVAGWVKPYTFQRAATPTVAPARRVILVDKPGAQDNQIYMLTPIDVALTSREAAAAEVFLAGMGYGLGARLGKALRVERGLTYHASSSLRRSEWPTWYAYSFGANLKAPQIVSGFFELFDAAKGGLTDQEVTLAKDQLIKAHANEMETPPDQMQAVAAAVAQGLPPSYPFQRPQLLKAVTAADVKAQAQAIGALNGSMLVIMGDAAEMQKPITAALPKGSELIVTKLSDLPKEGLEPATQVKP